MHLSTAVAQQEIKMADRASKEGVVDGAAISFFYPQNIPQPNPFSLRIEISLTDCPSLAWDWKTLVSRVRSPLPRLRSFCVLTS